MPLFKEKYLILNLIKIFSMKWTPFTITALLLYLVSVIIIFKHSLIPNHFHTCGDSVIYENLFLNILPFTILGIIIHLGFKWSKYILLVFTLSGLLQLPQLLQGTLESPNLTDVSSVIQRILLLIGTIILFKPLKTEPIKTN